MLMNILFLVFVTLSCNVCNILVYAQPDGWKMTDRFYGFRYEIFGKVTDHSILEGIQIKANSMGCFGWVQVGGSSNIVGEARCSKAKGKVFQDWLENMPDVTRFERLVSLCYQEPICRCINFKTYTIFTHNSQVYTDTKIRLHFSHFKILDVERDTCFLDKPHQCSDITAGADTKWKIDNNGEVVKDNTDDRNF
jgi:hypothetical protein